MPPRRPRARQKPRPVKRMPVRTKEALSFLPESLRKEFPPGPKRQRFEAALNNLSSGRIRNGRALRAGHIPVLARAAAEAVLGLSIKPPKGKSKRSVLKACRTYAALLPKLSKSALKWLPRAHRVILPSGSRVCFFADIGRSLGQYYIPGPTTRVMVKPIFNRRKHSVIAESLDCYNRNRDIVGTLRGSIGYVPIRIHTESGSNKPILIVHGFQPRTLELPGWFRKGIKNWELPVINYLEEIARRAGASKIAVVSPEHVDAMELFLNPNIMGDRVKKIKAKQKIIKAYYQRLASRLEKSGFVRQELKLMPTEKSSIRGGKRTVEIFFIPDKVSSRPFLVKELR